MKPPVVCSVCGGAHSVDAHRLPDAAAREWARAVLGDAQRASTARAKGLVGFIAEDRRAQFWSAQTGLLLRRAK